MSIKFYPLVKNIDIVTVRDGERIHVYTLKGKPTTIGNIKSWRLVRNDGLHEVFASDVNELKKRLKWKYGRKALIKIHYK